MADLEVGSRYVTGNGAVVNILNEVMLSSLGSAGKIQNLRLLQGDDRKLYFPHGAKFDKDNLDGAFTAGNEFEDIKYKIVVTFV